jgi:DNA-binding LytR/AlgR family response regulator
MRAIIIEDELLAQAKLETMLRMIDPSIQIEAKLGSVKASVEWLAKNTSPDVAFVDIQLSDDHSFEIFRSVNVQFPVIFTTAFDKYLLESFEFNSIDYLLKPITEEKLRRSLQKMKNFEHHFQSNLLHLIQDSKQNSQTRIVVKKGTEFIAINIEDIAYFFTDHRIVFLRDFHGKQFIADKNLTEIEMLVKGHKFFRINRKYIANIKAIEKFKPDNGKIKVSLTPEMKEEIFVSKETAPDFRKWIGNE